MEEFPVSLHESRGSHLAGTLTRFTASDTPYIFLQVCKPWQIGSGTHIWEKNLTCASINMTIQENSETKYQQFWHILLVAVQKRKQKTTNFSIPHPTPKKVYILIFLLNASCGVYNIRVNIIILHVYKRAARFVTMNYSYETGSMTGILEELKWETLQKRRKDNRLILMYKGLKGKARIPTDDLIPKNRRCINQHSLVFQIPSASKDSYKKSSFP